MLNTVRKLRNDPGAKARGFLLGVAMCKCAERRVVIRQALQGDTSIAQASSFVVRTLAQDASAAVAAARARLATRAGR